MALVYIVLGIAFILKKEGVGELIPLEYVPVLGTLLIIYGLFRGYRAFTLERNSIKK
jgi:hypothetical protein